MDGDGLKTLSYKTEDIEPGVPDPVEVEIGGNTFIARCPNDYEFYKKILPMLRAVEADPGSFDLELLLKSFFKPADAAEIDEVASGPDATISLLGELLPCLNALADHYQPLIEARFDKMKKSISGPKGQPGSLRAGRKS